MPKYVIERDVQGVGASTQEQLQGMAHKSNEVLSSLKGEVQWLQTYVTDDKIYCVYVAPNEELVRRHAQLAGFPADRISKVDAVLDPSSGEMPSTSRMSGKGQESQQTLRQ